MATFYNPKIVTDGLVLCLDAANPKSYPGSGTTWNDLSVNKYSATIRNSPIFSNNEFLFDGTNEYVELSSPSRRFSWAPAGSTGYRILTIEVWVKTSDTTGFIVSKPWNGSGVYNYMITPTTLQTVVATYQSASFTSIADGTWKHVVAILNETQKALYVNGKLHLAFTNHNEVSDTPNSGDASVPLSVMTLYPYGDGVWNQPTHAINGSMSNFRMYGRQLSESEILQNFNAMRGRFGI